MPKSNIDTFFCLSEQVFGLLLWITLSSEFVVQFFSFNLKLSTKTIRVGNDFDCHFGMVF